MRISSVHAACAKLQELAKQAEQDAAKDMAVWHIAFVLPQSIALPIAGGMLSYFGRAGAYVTAAGEKHYGPGGYTALFFMAAAWK